MVWELADFESRNYRIEVKEIEWLIPGGGGKRYLHLSGEGQRNKSDGISEINIVNGSQPFRNPAISSVYHHELVKAPLTWIRFSLDYMIGTPVYHPYKVQIHIGESMLLRGKSTLE